MSTLRYKFRNAERRRKRMRGGSRASDYVLTPLKTGCAYDASHLRPNNTQVSLDTMKNIVYNISGGGDTHSEDIPKFMSDNMTAAEPGKPNDFVPNSNLPEPSECLNPKLKYSPVNEQVTVHLPSFPEEGIPSSSHSPFKNDPGQSGGKKCKCKRRRNSKRKHKRNKCKKRKSKCMYMMKSGGRRVSKKKSRVAKRGAKKSRRRRIKRRK